MKNYRSCCSCDELNGCGPFPLVLALSANSWEYRGSSCIPFSSIVSIALCNAFKFSWPPGPGWPGGPDVGGTFGPGDDAEGFYKNKTKDLK